VLGDLEQQNLAARGEVLRSDVALYVRGALSISGQSYQWASARPTLDSVDHILVDLHQVCRRHLARDVETREVNISLAT
jgi:hypothetical protein